MTLQEALVAMVASVISPALSPIRERLTKLEAKPALSAADRALLDELAAVKAGAPTAPTPTDPTPTTGEQATATDVPDPSAP